MDKINKTLAKMPNDERTKLLATFKSVIIGQLSGLNIKKIKGHKDLYRLRVGKNRLVYRQLPGQKPEVVYVGRRDDQTYRDF